MLNSIEGTRRGRARVGCDATWHESVKFPASAWHKVISFSDVTVVVIVTASWWRHTVTPPQQPAGNSNRKWRHGTITWSSDDVTAHSEQWKKISGDEHSGRRATRLYSRSTNTSTSGQPFWSALVCLGPDTDEDEKGIGVLEVCLHDKA